MIQHQSEILFLLDDLVPFLVEYAAKTVKRPVETSSHKTALVKAEVKLLILQRIEHIRHFFPHLLGGDKKSNYGSKDYSRNYRQYKGYIYHIQILTSP